MNDNTAYVLLMSLFLSWIPILSLGKATSMIIEACKDKYMDDYEESDCEELEEE
jgi:hypothetical protein